MAQPQRIFLDTNVYIFGFDQSDNPEKQILSWLAQSDGIVVLISSDLIEQIRRVAKRQLGKDKAGEILDQIWRNYPIEVVVLTVSPPGLTIPREDWEIYLTAKQGKADCFVSNNRELIRAIAAFECLTPEAFVKAYL
jgi:predicted nucleic acid-binding protein